jgi:DNA replication and repair protein RecF
VNIEVNGRPAKRFASQGQQRMAVLSLKIAETQALQEATGRVPILLLDDISSELDRVRNRELFEFLRTVGGQVFITTTHLDHVLIDTDRQDFFVENGVVTA